MKILAPYETDISSSLSPSSSYFIPIVTGKVLLATAALHEVIRYVPIYNFHNFGLVYFGYGLRPAKLEF